MCICDDTSPPTSVSVNEAFDLTVYLMKGLQEDKEKLTLALKKIRGMCGHPDAAQGCRNILEEIKNTMK